MKLFRYRRYESDAGRLLRSGLPRPGGCLVVIGMVAGLGAVIGRYNYAVDSHAAKPDLASYEQYAEDFKKLRYGKGESYGIPYRCLTWDAAIQQAGTVGSA